MSYKIIDPLKDGNKVQYVGVYVLRWKPEWGIPSVGFVTDDTEDKLRDACRAALNFLEALDANAEIDFSNGVEAFGVDEGTVRGEEAFKQTIEQLKEVLK